jgi:hypothetical protein
MAAKVQFFECAVCYRNIIKKADNLRYPLLIFN